MANNDNNDDDDDANNNNNLNILYGISESSGIHAPAPDPHHDPLI